MSELEGAKGAQAAADSAVNLLFGEIAGETKPGREMQGGASAVRLGIANRVRGLAR